MQRNRLPKELAHYLEDTDQTPATMTDEEILNEAEWVMYLLFTDDGNSYNECAKASDKKAVKRFVERESKRLGR